MHALRMGAVPLLATMAMAACSDRGPTASAPAYASTHVAARASADIRAFTVPPTGGFTVQVLSRARFPDITDATFRVKLDQATKVVHVDDPTDVVVAKVTLQPGGSVGWHTHPGPSITSVASGELTVIHADDCVTRRYAAGSALVDLGQGNVHIGFNASTVETILYVTFLHVPPGQGPTIAAPDPGC